MSEELHKRSSEAVPALLVLTAENIKELTNFELQAVYPGFHRENGYITPQVHDDRERLADEYGEDNVLTSFLIEDDQLKLGLFLRSKG